MYNVLNVKETADAKDIKSAFYEQSKKLHPDTKPDDDQAPEKFRELLEAYEILSDPTKRKKYDDFRNSFNRPARASWTPESNEQSEFAWRPKYGVDPKIHRNIDVDLSEERMKKAWEAYKERWKREEEHLRELEEKKVVKSMANELPYFFKYC